MYICICNAIRDTELRDAARICDGDVDSIYRTLGRIPQCRQCLNDAEDIIEAERNCAKAGRCGSASGHDEAILETLASA